MTTTSTSPRALLGALVGDAVAMPVHWYYDRAALKRDYGVISKFVSPHNPHADSILWRSSYNAINARGEILHEQAKYWGQRGIHYHQFLKSGENTLNFQLATYLFEQVRNAGKYDADVWLTFYIDFMLTPGQHQDTYIEEYHREFFTHYSQGTKPRNCGVKDVHIGGLATVPALFDALAEGTAAVTIRANVQEHVGLTHRDAEVLEAADILTCILIDLKSGTELKESIFKHSKNWISESQFKGWNAEPDDVVIGQYLSPACYIKDAFPGALYLALKYANDFTGGICANAQAGGDSCHRAAVVGALLGQANGVPEVWRSGLVRAPLI